MEREEEEIGTRAAAAARMLMQVVLREG